MHQRVNVICYAYRNLKIASLYHIAVRRYSMPQPLSRVSPDAILFIANAGERALEKRPELAILAMESIASWSNVESFFLNMFVELLGGERSIAANIYLSLENQSAKDAAIRSAGETALAEKPDEHRILKSIMKLSKSYAKERNKLAHWVWGFSPQITDGIILVDPKNLSQNPDRSKIFVYKERDFEKIISMNDNLCRIGLLFNFILNGHPANMNGELTEKLLKDPVVSEHLR